MSEQGIQENLEGVSRLLLRVLNPPALTLRNLSGLAGTEAATAYGAGAAARYVKLQNVSAEPPNPADYDGFLIGYSFFGTAEIGAPGTFVLGPGDEVEMGEGRVPGNALSIVGSSDGLPYTLNVG